MKILDRIHLRAPLKHLACAVALGLGAGTTHAAVIDISGTNINIDTVVGAGNTGRLIGDTSTATSAFTSALDLNGYTLTLNGGNKNGAISGNGVVIVKGNIAGSTGNTYTGTTTVSGSVTLQKTAGNALCGDISVGASASLNWSYANQISDLSNMTLSATASLALAGKADTIAGLTLATGALVNTGAGGVLTANSLTVAGVVQPGGTYTSSNSAFVTGSGSVVVLPAGTSYEIWASTNAGGGAPNEDYDHDGMSNGLRYYMGAAGTLAAISPPVVTTAGVRTVTWPRDPSAIASFKVQVSTNLSTWTDVVPPNAAIDESIPTQVTYTLPAGAAKQFCRLVVMP
ncbi:MAG: hypothetical protein NTW21_07645 [Verrucomicrobia bacterium]|nr:hypothetical protein [Verrucomicrobiota bacterium]